MGRDPSAALSAGSEEVDLIRISDAETVLAMREAIERVEISEPVGRYLVDVVRATSARWLGSRSARAPVAHWRFCLRLAGSRRARQAGSSSCPTTSRTSPSLVLHTGSCSCRTCGFAAGGLRTWSASASTRYRFR